MHQWQQKDEGTFGFSILFWAVKEKEIHTIFLFSISIHFSSIFPLFARFARVQICIIYFILRLILKSKVSLSSVRQSNNNDNGLRGMYFLIHLMAPIVYEVEWWWCACVKAYILHYEHDSCTSNHTHAFSLSHEKIYVLFFQRKPHFLSPPKERSEKKGRWGCDRL